MAQNSSSGPTWYDILGIKPEATPEQIKAAWRNATDKFEPGTGAAQFRLFNEAADVLMDSDKRAAYDAEIGVAPTAPFEAVAAQPAGEPLAGTPVPDAPSAPTPLEPAEPAAGIALETKIVAVIA